jgi:hypothetical protein
MNISFITLNRFVEDKAASDEDYRRQLQRRGKVLLSHGRALSDEALLAKLRSLDLGMDEDQFRTLSQRFFSAQEMAQAVYAGPGRDLDGQDQDWVWIAFTCLWERWLPDRPSLEMIDDRMQDGYKLVARDDSPGACRLWMAAWKGIWNLIEVLRIHSLEEFDARFPLTNFVFNWVQDFQRELYRAPLDDRAFLQERLAVLETLLGRLQLDDLLLTNCKTDLAETYFALGMPEKGEQLYRQWLQDEPRWGWGWIRWSDCYYLFAPEQARDAARAEAILKQGLAVPEIRDKQHLLDRLADLYADTGRADEAQALRAQSPEPEPPAAALTQEAAATHPQIQEAGSFREKGSPLQDSGRLLAPLLGESPGALGGKARVGRNDPCPCGSGKEFKRCCGGHTR